MKVGSYESKFFFHKKLPLCVALWADINVVTTLCNCFPPELLRAGLGVDRRRKGDDGRREKDPTAVQVPRQTKVYVETFHIIDKKNMKDAIFDLKGVSKKHNWSPKINRRYYNIHGGNAATFYERTCKLFTPGNRVLGSKERMADLAHHLCSVGEPMRSRLPRHPPVLRDLSRVFNSGVGRKIRSDARGICQLAKDASGVMARAMRVKTLRYKQAHREGWRVHQSMACERRGYCAYECCPGQGVKRLRQRETNMRCEQCSETLGEDVFLCNGTLGRNPDGTWIVINCHAAYHRCLHNKK